MPPAPDDVISFWFGQPGDPHHGQRRAEWFRKDAAFDQLIARRFGPTLEAALRGELDHWAASMPAALALLIVLDQFTRNVFRDTPRAFAGDAQALAVARAVVARGDDRGLRPEQRPFVYLPFEHAESLACQDESLRLFTQLAAEDAASEEALTWARRHHDVIRRFGRFPHRNTILGRADTPEETEFLREPGSRF